MKERKFDKVTSVIIALGVAACGYAQNAAHTFDAVNFSKVNITDAFWKPKIDKVATVTMDACIYQTEEKTARIRNFEKVIRAKGEKHEGIYYDDSDVYKALEAMAYSLKTHPDARLEAKADEWIDKIAGAQLPDGYLNTYYTLGNLNSRWTDVEKHEDYNAGHLLEAAVAYYNATGKRKLLDVAIRFADHIDSVFRLANRKWISGHEEIELALVKLYRVTKNDRYLKLADWYLEQRGYKFPYPNSWITPAYWQDVLPVKEQTEITGHAVRAMYLYTGAADVASITGDKGYLNSMEKVWQDVVHRNMYITGGIGSSGDNEGFDKDYELPNGDAYCETCASVGMVFWNQRMNQLTGSSKYIDVLERSLYNGALDGLSLTGDRFFYDNPLASNGQHSRKAWFGTACCPSNIARLVTSVGNYIYGQSKDGIYINLFISSDTKLQLGKNEVAVKSVTNYPWEGKINVSVDPVKSAKFKVYLRVPGWARREPVPGGLYHVVNTTGEIMLPTITLNGNKVEYKMQDGYAVVERTWRKGDLIQYDLPMEVLKIKTDEQVEANRDRIAIQRGPLVYCVEAADNPSGVWNILVDEKTLFQPVQFKVNTEEVIALKGEMKAAVPDQSGLGVSMQPRTVTAIPYYTWANRGPHAMQVWLPLKIKKIQLNNDSQKHDGGL